MSNTSFITKIDHLGPHRITTTGQNGVNYSITNISIDNNCSDSFCVKDQKKDMKKTINKSEAK